MAPPDQSDGSTPNVDDPEWIKGLVAKALLHAADDGVREQSPLPPTPALRPASEWPVLTSLDTAAFASSRAPHDIVSTSIDTAPASIDSSQALPVLTDEPAYVDEPIIHDRVPDAVLVEDRPLDPGEDRDAVMVETDATTEGYRSSDIRTVLEWLAVIVSALVVALLIKALVLQAFWIPSESMETTVNKGDRILVNKVSYRLHEIRRGDLVVFEKLEGTPGNTKDLIKRAIALPGETIEVRSDGRIWIWGAGETPDDAKLLEEPYLDPQNAVLSAPSASDPLTSDVWDERCANQPRTPGRCTLDEESYFMMGDNRNRSSDSRFFGPVPDENVVGRAFLRIWPLGDISTL